MHTGVLGSGRVPSGSLLTSTGAKRGSAAADALVSSSPVRSMTSGSLGAEPAAHGSLLAKCALTCASSCGPSCWNSPHTGQSICLTKERGLQTRRNISRLAGAAHVSVRGAISS
jgi:hypothetical protein